MQILQHPISKSELARIAGNTFGDMVKAVADVKRGNMAIDADLHADLERLLLEDGSSQENLWGFNLWVEEDGDDFIEFDSLINIRSWQGNPSRDITVLLSRSVICLNSPRPTDIWTSLHPTGNKKKGRAASA